MKTISCPFSPAGYMQTSPSLFLLTMLLVSSIGCSNDSSPEAATPLHKKFEMTSQDYAFIIPNLKPVAGVGGVKAIDCGACHKSIYHEWSNSTHANALKDIQFIAEITKKDSPKWICLNCHIPIQNQREEMVTHLQNGDILRPVKTPNPMFDKEMQQEGVTCASCHVRADDKTGESYIVGAIGSPYAPHPVRKDPQFLKNICSRCHNPEGEDLTPNLSCWFKTEQELEEGQQALIETYGNSRNCIDCHMPPVERRLVGDFSYLPERMSHQHNWVGGGIPKWYSHYNTLLERGYESGLTVNVLEIPEILPNGELHVAIELKNEKAGHYLPTGDPERFILAVATLTDITGQDLEQQTLTIGQTWQWNPARKVEDNRLGQGESITWQVGFSLPQKIDGLSLILTIYHVRLTSENAGHIIEAENVDENLLKDGARLVTKIADEYPFATYVFKETVELASGQRYRFTPAELIELSKLEQGRELSSRDY